MASPTSGDSTTRFALFFLILWILVTVALLALAMLRKFQLPNFIRGDKRVTMIFAFLQLTTFTLLLAALALDQWGYTSFRGGWSASGVVSYHNSASDRTQYSCSSYSGEGKTSCGTFVAAGAFTLIFGLIAIVTSAALLVVVGLSLFGIGAIDRVKPFVDVMANIQWITLLAMTMIWSISGYTVQNELGGKPSGFHLGDSWALCFVSTVLAIGEAFFFSGGAGETIKGGEASAPAQSAGPTPAAAGQPAPWTNV